MTMYFDDISRFNTNPFKSRNIRFATSPKPKVPNYASEKLSVLQKDLCGYNPQSASLLASAEVELVVREWFDRVDFANEFLGTADFESTIRVHNSTTVIGCYTELWHLIHEYTENAVSGQGEHNSRGIDMIVFPNCPELYNYETMGRITAELQACLEYCSTFGNDFQVSGFHPNYENEPRMLSPARHSPLPCFGIHKNDGKNTTYEYVETRSMESVDEIESLVSGIVDQSRNDLEDLFNSEAASDVNGAIDASTRSSTPNADSEYFISLTTTWMKNNSHNGTNQALKYSETIGDRWIISNSIIEESIYKEIWDMIHELEQLQMQSISNEKEDTTSYMFVATKFSMYNAQRFKKFAVSINKTLKTLSHEIFIELFHPEFVGKNEDQSVLRRSPFPCLQVVSRNRGLLVAFLLGFDSSKHNALRSNDML